MAILAWMARSLLRAPDNVATPCSVNAKTFGACLIPELVTIRDKSMISSRVREKHEVRRKPLLVSFHCLHKHLWDNFVKYRKMHAEHDLLTADEKDAAFNIRDRDDRRAFIHAGFPFPCSVAFAGQRPRQKRCRTACTDRRYRSPHPCQVFFMRGIVDEMCGKSVAQGRGKEKPPRLRGHRNTDGNYIGNRSIIVSLPICFMIRVEEHDPERYAEEP